MLKQLQSSACLVTGGILACQAFEFNVLGTNLPLERIGIQHFIHHAIYYDNCLDRKRHLTPFNEKTW